MLFDLFKKQDPDVISGTTGFKNPNSAGQFVAGLINMNRTGLSYHWVFEKSDDQSTLGFCDFYLPAPHLIHLKNCEISFGILPQYRRQGFMKEALNACLNYIFKRAHFQRAEAYVSPTNLPSIALLELMGFQNEGLQRKKWLVEDQRYDMKAYALLAEDFLRT